MLVWILQTGEPLPSDDGESRPMRGMNLASYLVSQGHDVVFWSSAFYHQEKRHRCNTSSYIKVQDGLEVRLISSPGYNSNFSFSRFYDHVQLALELRKNLKRENHTPDVAFIGYPPIEAAYVLSAWLKKRKVPFLIDIKDQWPDYILNSLPGILRPLIRLIAHPYYMLAKKTIDNAVGISTVSNQYLRWSLNFVGRNKNAFDKVSFLVPQDNYKGAGHKNAIEWWDSLGVKDDGGFKVIFIGTHSIAFDFQPVIHCIREFDNKGEEVTFVLCGFGENTDYLKKKTKEFSNVIFPGWIDKAKILALSERSSVGLAPYVNIDNFSNNIPNKIIDYLSLGLPVVSPLYGEVKELIARNNVGVSYQDGSGSDLYATIQKLYQQPDLCNEMSVQAKNLYKTKFTYNKVYGGLVSHLEHIASNNNGSSAKR